jgi:hypothetical protein
MEKKAPFSGDDFERLLREQFLRLDQTKPENEKIMETVSQHVAGSDVFVASSTSAPGFVKFLKKWGFLSLGIICTIAIWLYLKPKEVIVRSSTPTPIATATPQVVMIDNPQYTMDPEQNPEPAKLILPLLIAKSDSATIAETYTPIVQEEKKNTELISRPDTIRKVLEEPSHLPNLTPNEIKANHKQKKKMIDRLIKGDRNTWVFIPSGNMVHKGENKTIQSFRMRSTEVTNLEYRTFLFDLLIEGKTDDFLKARPIQSMWRKRFSNGNGNDPMVENYFSHPAYNEYPVVNITRKGALMYCEWLTNEANKTLRQSGKPEIEPLRLPMEMEWVYAAMGNIPNSKNASGTDSIKNAKGCYLANYSCLEENNAQYDSILRYYIPKDKNGFNLIDDGGFHTVNGSSYNPNPFGLYCMSGNVSEMIVRKNVSTGAFGEGTIGGSWMSPAQFLRFDAPEEWPFELNGPSPMIGFRPVYTFIAKPKK